MGGTSAQDDPWWQPWAAHGAAGWWVEDRNWLHEVRRAPCLVYLGSGLGITVLVEWLSVHVFDRWTYDAAMPVVLGVGLTPVLQRLVLPLIVWLAWRHLGSAAFSPPT